MNNHPQATPVALALGTNLGDRMAQLHTALGHLRNDIHGLTHSPVYETAPWGMTEQPDFLNLAVSGQTTLSPLALLACCKAIEATTGRRPTIRYGPRVIDIDIIFYGTQVVASHTLTVPHPHLAERRFVLQPLADIAPGWQHPLSGQTVAAMLAALPPDDAGEVRLYSRESLL